LRSQSPQTRACNEPTIKLRKPGETEVAPLFNEQTNGPGETGGKQALKRKRNGVYAMFGAPSNDISKGEPRRRLVRGDFLFSGLLNGKCAVQAQVPLER
jgi:hypothetical protein